MLPMITRFQDAYQLDEVTVVAGAGMVSAANKQALIDAGLHYILSVKPPTVPEMIETWRRENPGEDYAHGQIWTQASAGTTAPMIGGQPPLARRAWLRP